MLIEFRLSNFRSIRDAQTLSMVASSNVDKEQLPQNVCQSDFQKDLHLVHSAVIYGANAAGKTNLIRALFFMRRLILGSAKESQQGEKIPVTPFLFDKKSCRQPSQFEIIFSKEGVRYQYGFAVEGQRIVEEWLFAYPTGRIQQWFTRKYDKKTNGYAWKFSKFFTGRKQLWRDSTRENALFLSTAVQLNNEQLIPVFNWFQEDLVVISMPDEMSAAKSITQLNTVEGKKKILKYLNIADPSISDISLESVKFSEDKIPKKIPDHIREMLKVDLIGKDLLKVNFSHPNECVLNLGDESHGIQQLFELSGYWIDALEEGKVLVVDELDNGLHPLSIRFLINLMNHSTLNQKKSQLVFSTHDTSLLDSHIFRHDQIWFVEKNDQSATQLYSLIDFNPNEGEEIGKSYLRGRYGALPFIGEWGF